MDTILSASSTLKHCRRRRRQHRLHPPPPLLPIIVTERLHQTSRDRLLPCSFLRRLFETSRALMQLVGGPVVISDIFVWYFDMYHDVVVEKLKNLALN